MAEPGSDILQQLQNISHWTNLVAPSNWWMTADTQGIYESYDAQTYEMTTYAKHNHGTLNLMRDTDFDWESDDYKRQTALTGVLFLALACLLLIILPITMICIRRCACCCRSIRNSSPKKSKLKWVALLMFILALGGMIVTLVGYVHLNDNLQTTNSLVQDTHYELLVGPQLQITATMISDEANNDMNTALDTFQSCAKYKSYYTEDMMTGFRDKSDQWQELATGAISQNDLSELNGLINEVGHISVEITNSEPYRRISLWILFAVDILILAVIGLVFFVIYFARRGGRNVNCCCVCIYRTGKFMTYILGVLVIVGACCVAAATIVFAMMGGDYCVNPDAYSTQFIENVGSAGETTASYYISCAGPYPEFYVQVTDIMEAMVNTSESIIDVKHEVDTFTPDECTRPFSDALSEQNSLCYGLYSSTELGTGALKCETVNILYSGLIYDVVCTDFQKSVILLWVGNVILMASLTVLLILWSLMNVQIENYNGFSKEDKDSSEQQPSGEVGVDKNVESGNDN